MKRENSLSIDPIATGQYSFVNHGWLDFYNNLVNAPCSHKNS